MPSVRLALVPVAALIVFLYLSIRIYDISPHVPLIMAIVVAAGLGRRIGYAWKDLELGLIHGIRLAMPAILILMAIGILIGTWIASGVVPLMIYYGLKLLIPEVFLPATCIVCAFVSLVTGSSWSTAGTVGVALIGVAQGLGVPLPMAAGAIISGAYFGDKMSPFSDTTNLAPAVAGSELFEHIRHMVWTTIPSILIALLLYSLIGIGLSSDTDRPAGINEMFSVIESTYELNVWLLLPPVAVVSLIAFRVPALPALLGGSVMGIVLGIGIQESGVKEMLVAAQEGYVSETGNQRVDELLTRGGLESMFGTISLIFCSMGFGGVMEKTRMLESIANAILSFASGAGKLTLAVVSTCIGMNVIAPDQYLSIIVPGRMYKSAYDKAGLHPKNLSRSLEDSGTMVSPLVPWNTCGAFMMGVLAINPFDYLPYAFVNLLTPFMSIVLGFAGWTMVKAVKAKEVA